MPKDNDNPQVWKYFKRGDIVKDSEDSVWGNALFEVTFFHGNWYCPMMSTNVIGKFYKSGRPQECNLDVREARLISARKRPFRKMKKIPLLKLMAKGNEEARREFTMRVNTKTL